MVPQFIEKGDKMKKKSKIHFSKTNQYVNIPKFWVEILDIKKGESIEMNLNVSDSTITLKKNGK